MELITELEAAARLGISTEALADLRKKALLRDDHWTKSHRKILYTALGLVAAASILAEKNDAPSASVATAVPGMREDDGLVEMIVWRPNLPNTRILEAHQDATDPHDPKNVVRVQVYDNRNFLRGMRFKARHVAGDLWTHWDPKTNTAARSPRARGRW